MLKGIDIYSCNLDDAKAPSWAAIRQGGFVFVLIKASEWNEDDGSVCAKVKMPPAHRQFSFANRWPQLKANGLFRGAYHLPRPDTDSNFNKVDAQMETFIRICPRLLPGDFGPILDMEDRKLYDDLHAAHSAIYWVPAAQRLLARMETALGRQAVIYTQRSWWQSYMNDAVGFDQYLPWVVDVNNPGAPVLPASWNTWSWWQWHYEESSSAMPAPFHNPADRGVDLDYFNGTMYELRGVADMGRPGVALISGSAAAAHSELDDHLHLLVNDGSSWSDTDLGEGSLPGGGADPVLLESAGTLYLYFRSGDALIQAASSGASSDWEATDLTEISVAKPIHDPRAVLDGDKRHVVYWGEDDDWYLLTCDNGWMSVGLLRDAKLGTATGPPIVFVQDGLPHVVGRMDGDGHLWEVWPDLAGGWKTEDVTAAALANDPATPAATYSPCAYETSAGVSLGFRAVGGELWVIDRASNTPTNLTAATSGIRGMGHPSCFVLNDVPHVVYRGIDGFIYDLWLEGGAWQVQPVCDDKMAADPVATADGTNAAVAVRAPDGMIHLAIFDGSGWRCDPTILATPATTGTPVSDNGVDDKSAG